MLMRYRPRMKSTRCRRISDELSRGVWRALNNVHCTSSCIDRFPFHLMSARKSPRCQAHVPRV